MPLNGALLLGSRRPSGGWAAKFRIKGIDHVLSGKSAGDVARKTMALHKSNGESLSWEDVWLNLNLQWIERTDHKYFSVSHATLAGNILPEGEKPATLRREITPEKWGSIAWKWLGLFLAQDNYSSGAFLGELEQVLLMLNPATNQTMGCSLCYADFAAEMGNLRLHPPDTRDTARKWLVSYHNKVNNKLSKPQLSFEKAAQLNFWA